MAPDHTLENFSIRNAEEKDVSIILHFIKALAEYENLSQEVKANEELLMEYLFHQKKAEVIIAEYQQQPIGFALFFHNFSTFLGRPGIYLEDLYIDPSMRGKGFGKALLSHLSGVVEERNYGRLEWSCLDWNEPSIRFYKSMGAKPMEDWTVYRIQKEVTE